MLCKTLFQVTLLKSTAVQEIIVTGMVMMRRCMMILRVQRLPALSCALSEYSLPVFSLLYSSFDKQQLFILAYKFSIFNGFFSFCFDLEYSRIRCNFIIFWCYIFKVDVPNIYSNRSCTYVVKVW